MNQITGKTPDGAWFLALVLEPANLHALRNGRPIRLRLEDHFPEGIPARLDLNIFHSDTPVALARELADMTSTVVDERTAFSKEKRPHCPECRSTIEQLGLLRSDAPIWMIYCPNCGCALGTVPKGEPADFVEAKPIVKSSAAG